MPTPRLVPDAAPLFAYLTPSFVSGPTINSANPVNAAALAHVLGQLTLSGAALRERLQRGDVPHGTRLQNSSLAQWRRTCTYLAERMNDQGAVTGKIYPQQGAALANMLHTIAGEQGVVLKITTAPSAAPAATPGLRYQK